ncbi:hypothetical protein V2W45_1339595 [Cenococcum geophilum]
MPSGQGTGTNPIHNKKPKKQHKEEDDEDKAFKAKQQAESSPLHPQPDVHTHHSYSHGYYHPHGLSHRRLSYYTPHTRFNTPPNILHIVSSTNTLFTPPLPTHPAHTTCLTTYHPDTPEKDACPSWPETNAKARAEMAAKAKGKGPLNAGQQGIKKSGKK